MVRRCRTSILLAHTVVAVLLVGTLGACGGNGENDASSDPTISPSPTTGVNPTANPSDPADQETATADYCQDQKPFTGEAADKFGADEVMDAYCTLVKLAMEQGFVDNYVRAAKEDLTVQDFSVWTDYMDRATADEWNATVTKALQGDEKAQENVYVLMYFQAIAPGGEYEFTDEPVVLNEAFTPATAAVDVVDGVERLVIRFKVTGDFNFVKTGTTEPYYKIASTRDVTFGLVRNPDTSNEDTDWLITGFTGTFKFGEMEERGPLSDAGD